MQNIRQIAWPRIFPEAAAIIVSILVAFWIDAWWEERQESEEALSLLQEVLKDLQIYFLKKLRNWNIKTAKKKLS